MYHISQDKRARESSQWIFAAIVQLTQHMAYDKITVTKLCETAKIGRVTFYRHFDTLDDVLRWQCDLHFLQFREQFHRLNATEAPAFFREFMFFWAKQPEFLQLIFTAERTFILEDSMERILIDAPSADYQAQTLQAIRNAICLTILKQWQTNYHALAPETLVEILLKQLNTILAPD